MIIENVDKLMKSEIKSNDLIVILLEQFNAILAGGSAHALHRGMTLQKYFTVNSTADLDLYFRTNSEYHEAVEFIKYFSNRTDREVSIEKSVTGMCHNIYQSRDFYSHGCRLKICKIQLVGCVHGTPSEIVKSFDFENLEICYYYDGENYLKCYSPRIAALNRLISVKHSRSPFLAHRLHKYIAYRGFTGITVRSKKHITDWIIKASTGYYDKNTDGCPSIYVDLLDNNAIKTILSNPGVIANEDLCILIGKIIEDINVRKKGINSRGYTFDTFEKVGTRDLAIEEINKRMRKNESK